jgi:hypothetical protein
VTVTEAAVSAAASPIVVAIHAARRCASTLELAGALAASIGADLDVVFVEDADLLRLADLPVTREIDRLSGMARDLDTPRVLRALRVEVQQLHRELARLGRSTSVRSTLRVVRGHYLTEALAASAHGQATFVHGARRALPGELFPAPTVSGSTAAAGAARGALWILFDGSAASVRALKVALALAPGRSLRVLVPGHGADEQESRKRAAQIAAGGRNLNFLPVAENWLSRAGRNLSPGAVSLLVLAKTDPIMASAAARDQLESLPVPVVLVA